MRCNDAGLQIIREFEGLKLKPYRCPAGVYTIGYGHTRGVTRFSGAITEEIAERMLLQDVREIEAQIPRLVTVALTGNQFSALCSFLFNVGPTRFRATTSQDLLNRGHYLEFADRLLIWNKAGGEVLHRFMPAWNVSHHPSTWGTVRSGRRARRNRDLRRRDGASGGPGGRLV